MAVRAIHIIMHWETLWSLFDRMWFLSSVKACERPRPHLLCKRWVHEWRKWQGEIKGRLPKGELHVKRQQGVVVELVLYIFRHAAKVGHWFVGSCHEVDSIAECGHWVFKDGMHAETPPLAVNGGQRQETFLLEPSTICQHWGSEYFVCLSSTVC